MNISRNGRFILGLLFLFSVCLFMGTESTGCWDCSKENNASITITNGSMFKLKIGIVGTTSKEFVLETGQTSVSWVESGQYAINALIAPFFTQSHYSGTVRVTPTMPAIIVIN